MKVIINDRDYELKELAREEARAYIQKDVYVWDSDADDRTKRKLLEVFQTDCDYPFCVLHSNGKSVCNYMYCAPVPEEWYVHQLPDGRYESICPSAPKHHTVDHGSKEYCEQKAKELNDKEMPCCECTHTYEPKIVCSGCDNKSKFERKETREETEEDAVEHPLTNYEVGQLLKCFGVSLCYSTSAIFNAWQYTSDIGDVQLPNGYKIRYKCGEWMPATRETVWKWWQEDCSNDIPRFISFMGWFEKKFYSEKYSTSIPLECISPTPDEIGG